MKKFLHGMVQRTCGRDSCRMSGYIKRSTWIIAVWFSLLTTTLSSHAASFDCAKAGNKVEHIICENAEISKLDDELNTAYKAALHDKQQTDAFKHAQKQWMKERNNCADAACVQSTYQKRIEQLHPSQNVTAAQAPATVQQVTPQSKADANATAKKYPPYPDVWDWLLPDREKILALGVRLIGMDTGDILINYGIYDKNGKYV